MSIRVLTLSAVLAAAATMAVAKPVAIQIGDLNLAREADRKVLAARADQAADQLCNTADFMALQQRRSCRLSVHAEVADLVAARTERHRMAAVAAETRAAEAAYTQP
ncbi:UrcA family protein [Caulobacter segnis]|uniref:UrcA family protein n=1 Tax=Caulobacter segnis TaxID=88688 RepID=UPI00240FB19C|nr:UrcA family protein [Caulobacter segnis]MDG2520451.1 UrcA family protein [Caulobacter segnis]